MSDIHKFKACDLRASALVVQESDYDALAQQLAASQAHNFSLNSASSLQSALRREDQATITRLEATITKALDLDYQRRQEIAEALGLLRRVQSRKLPWAGDPIGNQIDAYLAAHEEKAND